jgi:hypothetical protein
MMGGIAAFGTLLQVEDPATPGTFLTVAEVKDISGPGITSDVLDTTTHTSPSAWRQKIPSLLDGGEVTFSVNYMPGDPTHDAATGLASMAISRAVQSWQVIYPDTDETLWSFDGFVTNFAPGAPVEDLLTADVTITVTGAVAAA